LAKILRKILLLDKSPKFVTKFVKNLLLDTANEIRNVDSSIQSPYSVKEFLIESAAELMLLGNSNRCIGTFISSFSHIACSMSKFRNDSLFYYRNNQLVDTRNVHL